MEQNIGKFNMAKFNGKGDFGLWKYKMINQLELLGLDSCLQEEPSTYTSDPGDPSDTEKGIARILLEFKVENDQGKGKQDKLDKDKVARNLNCMSLEDPVLRKVMKEITPIAVW